MTDDQWLWLVRAAHTTIYLLMASAVFVVVYGGVTGAHGAWLWTAAGLVGVEAVVFAASGMRCPLTALAVKYSPTRPGVSDTFLPERITRHTLKVFGPLILLGLALLAARLAYLGWR